MKGFAIFLNMENLKRFFLMKTFFFLFFEEIDLCTRVKKRRKIYLNKNIIIKHEGAGSVNKV